MLLNDAVKLLESRKISLTLMDVGASGDIFAPFVGVLPISTLVGFDPDLRAMKIATGQHGEKIVVLSKAVTATPGQHESRFFLTKSPSCSSTLKPDLTKLSQWPYAGLFEVNDTVSVPAITIAEALVEVGHTHIDWLKVDTQGTDLRIIKSLPDEIRGRIIACDAEPGFYEHYENADRFGALHDYMVDQGFWLADLNLQAQPRISSQNYPGLLNRAKSPWVQKLLLKTLKRSPTAPEARYIRTIPSAIEHGYSCDQFLSLWAISIATGNLEYAYDVACEFAKLFPSDRDGRRLADRTAKEMLGRALKWAVSPAFIKIIVKKVSGKLF